MGGCLSVQVFPIHIQPVPKPAILISKSEIVFFVIFHSITRTAKGVRSCSVFYSINAIITTAGVKTGHSHQTLCTIKTIFNFTTDIRAARGAPIARPPDVKLGKGCPGPDHIGIGLPGWRERDRWCGGFCRRCRHGWRWGGFSRGRCGSRGGCRFCWRWVGVSVTEAVSVAATSMRGPQAAIRIAADKIRIMIRGAVLLA